MNSWKLKNKNFVLAFCAFQFAILTGCGQPNLESAECRESRDMVKRFYSFHIGSEMKPSRKNLEERAKYLSGSLRQQVSNRIDSEYDYFTQTSDYPKAFRVGACETIGLDKASFEVLLFWKEADKNVQRALRVEVAKEMKNWLIDKVEKAK